MLNVEFLNAEIVSLLGNLLYSRVIYLKKTCWMLCGRKRVTSTKIYVASHKSSTRKKRNWDQCYIRSTIPSGSKVLVPRNRGCPGRVMLVPILSMKFDCSFFHTMLTHTHTHTYILLPHIFPLVKYPECNPRRKFINLEKKLITFLLIYIYNS